ncbi:MAG: GNAT family N-acetyltransferase [Chloroflexi bacterium]|nr:MAG: GNAT family N-acetyltransferase [Chloroflexota bacterium]TMF37202.1 MAG: GNAT family N-acetyltransferase [Chloroflexota bacterium]
MGLGEMLLIERTLLGLTGGPTADFNLCLADGSANLELALNRAVEHARTRSLPTLFMVSTEASKTLTDRLNRLDLTAVGEAPLMAFTGAPPAVDPAFQVDLVSEPVALNEVAELIAKAFELDRHWVGRTFASTALLDNTSTVGFYLVRREGRPISTVTISGEGSVIGIWSMATDPELQRQGAGRAALAGAMTHRWSLGARAFYLIATPAGKPLYDAVGFTTVETFPMFMLAPTH